MLQTSQALLQSCTKVLNESVPPGLPLCKCLLKRLSAVFCLFQEERLQRRKVPLKCPLEVRYRKTP